MNSSFGKRHAFRYAFFLLFAVSVAGICYAGSQNDLLVIVEHGKYGYIDHEGKVIITPQFIWADDFWRGFGTVYVCGRYASIDASGALHPLRIAVEGHLAPRKSGDNFGFVDGSGQFKIAPTFDEVLPFSEGLAAVRIGKKWGFVDPSGKMAIHPQFNAAFYFREGVGVADLDSGYALIDRSGKVLANGFQFVDLIKDGRVPASLGEKWGFLDLRGRAVIPFIYDTVNPFFDGLAAVERGKKWGYIDRDGKLVIPFKFDHAGPFGHGLAPAKQASRTGFIDKSGNFAFSLAFDYAPGFLTGDEESNLFVAPADISRFWTGDGQFGYVNTSGHVIWGPVNASPDHPPLLGWSDEDKARSCEGFPQSTKSAVAGFPER